MVILHPFIRWKHFDSYSTAKKINKYEFTTRGTDTLRNEMHLWHNQGVWVTCRQFSILIFQYKSIVHFEYYIWIQILSQSDIWFRRYEQFFNFKNNVKHKNLSLLSACNSKSIFPTSDSLPLIMPHLIPNQLIALYKWWKY